MTKKKVAVFDADKRYRERFADYLMSYKAAEMELAVFSSITFLKEALETEQFHLLVSGTGDEAVLVAAKGRHIPVLVLTEYVQSYVREVIDMIDEEVLYVSKYQSMDAITKQMQLMMDTKEKEGEMSGINRKLEIIGIFSPIRHEMQMLFSMLYAKNAARRDKVLYLNLLEFSGFSEIFGEAEYDMGDVVLQLRDGADHDKGMEECIYEEEMFSYIPPFLNPENVREITSTDVKCLLEWIAKNTDYRIVVLDVGMNVNEFAKVLLSCTKVYCLGKKGYLFEVQMRQFEAYLERLGGDTLGERIVTLELPGQVKAVCGGTHLLEQLDWGELGDFVRTKM